MQRVVVDIRYHLASLVAIFLALGLGILVGTSLSNGVGASRQEEWLTSLERELQAIQIGRRESAALLLEIEQERDLYRGFADEVQRQLAADRLTGERTALVLLGEDRAALDSVQSVLRDSGASVVRLAHVRPVWNERLDHFLALLSSEEHELPMEPGARLASLVGTPTAGGFTSIDSPSLWFEAASLAAPTSVAIVVDGPVSSYAPLFETTSKGLIGVGLPVAVVALPASRSSEWYTVFRETGLPYVAHLDSPLGRLSLVAILAGETSQGPFGLDQGQRPWPSSLTLPGHRAEGVR